MADHCPGRPCDRAEPPLGQMWRGTARIVIFGAMIYVLYHGYVDLYIWEYFLSIFYIIGLYVWFSRVKNLHIRTNPEYKYFLWGFMAKVVGGMIFALIYFYHYKGGDTIMYFYSAISSSKLMTERPLTYLKVMFGENSLENWNLYDLDTGYPYQYIYFDSRTWMVIRLLNPLVSLAFRSYLVTTVMLASVAYIGVWRCFRMFVGYFPSQMGKLAVAFLFVPSVIFWGSGVGKDTFTFSGTCFFVYAVDQWFFKRNRSFANAFGGVASAALVIYIKPYIFMALLPSMLLWVLYARITGIRNTLIRLVVVPMGFFVLVAGTIAILSGLGDKLGKFSLDNAVATTMITNLDMTKNMDYSANYFDIGPMDGTWSGLLSRAPTAVFAALFRPRLDEARNPVMLISGLENAWLLWLVVSSLLHARIVFVPRFIFGNPIVLMCLSFSVVFGFVIGISTPNFGALVRFKIPMLPFFISGLVIINYIVKLDRHYRERNKRLDLADIRQGTAHLSPEDELPVKGARGRGRRPSRPRPAFAAE